MLFWGFALGFYFVATRINPWAQNENKKNIELILIVFRWGNWLCILTLPSETQTDWIQLVSFLVLDLLVRWLEKKQKSSPNDGFHGDESRGRIRKKIVN